MRNTSTIFSSVFLNDMYRFDTISFKWIDMNKDIKGKAPSVRSYLGLTSIGSKLYVFGGWEGDGQS